MNKILIILCGLILSMPLKAGQWIYNEGGSSSFSTGQAVVDSYTITLTTNNTVWIFFNGLMNVSAVPITKPIDGVGAGVFYGTNLWQTGLATGFYQHDYSPTVLDWWTIPAQGRTNLPAGTYTLSIQKTTGVDSGALINWRTSIYLDNEFGPSDNRIISMLADTTSNLTSQINSVSNSLSAQMVTMSNLLANQNIATSNMLTGQITTLSNLNASQITSLSNQLLSVNGQLLLVNGQVTTNTSNIASLQSQLSALTSQYNSLSNTVAGIPSQIQAVNDSLNEKTSGVLGGSTWNDVVSFMGLGTGLIGAGSGIMKTPTPSLGTENVPEGTARPGYYE